MRRILFIPIFLLCASITHAAPCSNSTVVTGIICIQSKNVDDNISTNTPTAAFVSNNGAGHLLIATSRMGTDTASGVPTDTAGNTWVLAASLNSTTTQIVYIWYVCNSIAGANTVTFNQASHTGRTRMAIFEYSGLVTSSCLDQNNQATATSTTADSGPITTTATKELIFSSMGNSLSGVFTAGGSYTVREPLDTASQAGSTEDQGLTSPGTVNGVWGTFTSATWISVVVSFKAPAPVNGGMGGKGGVGGKGGME